MFRRVLVLTVALLAVVGASAEDVLKPYCLSTNDAGTVADRIAPAKEALTGAGFEIVGEYTPYDGAHLIVVTNDVLKSNAAASDFGGYGAVQRVALTQVGDNVQVSWTNPVYMANVYRLEDDLSDVKAQLESALGEGEPFGSEEGIKPEKLRKYHYMAMMPYFDEPIELAAYDSHADAVEAVEAGLSEGVGETELIYRVDIPGKDETVFGVGVRGGKGADEVVMGTCDLGEFKHTAYMPYELLVSEGVAYCLHGRFRIALSFPDLGMGTFTKIMGAPGGISDALEAAAKGE